MRLSTEKHQHNSLCALVSRVITRSSPALLDNCAESDQAWIASALAKKHAWNPAEWATCFTAANRQGEEQGCVLLLLEKRVVSWICMQHCVHYGSGKLSVTFFVTLSISMGNIWVASHSRKKNREGGLCIRTKWCRTSSIGFSWIRLWSYTLRAWEASLHRHHDYISIISSKPLSWSPLHHRTIPVRNIALQYHLHRSPPVNVAG